MKLLSRGNTRLFFLAFVVLSLLLMSVPSGAQTRELGTCVADSQGRFPSDVHSCILRIPNDTQPGEYNLVGRCPVRTGADSYPPTNNGGASTHGPLGVSTNRVVPGQTLVASGENCRPNSIVRFTLERIGPLSAMGNLLTGTASAQAGTRTMTARITVVDPDDRDRDRRATTAIIDRDRDGRVVRVIDDGAAKRGVLARTGIEAKPLLMAGLGALALGSLFVAAGRRRSKKASEATS